MNKQIDIFSLMAVLEMPESILTSFKWTYETSEAGLQEFKEKVKKQRRLLAKKYHPDLAKGNDELMKKINSAADALLGLEIKRPQPQFARQETVLREAMSREAMRQARAASRMYSGIFRGW